MSKAECVCLYFAKWWRGIPNKRAKCSVTCTDFPNLLLEWVLNKVQDLHKGGLSLLEFVPSVSSGHSAIVSVTI